MAQAWLQLSIRTSPENIDALSNFLMERGAPGVVLKKIGLDAFFAAPLAGARLRRDVDRFIGALGRLSPRRQKTRLQWTTIKQENWEHSWKRFIKPRRVGKSFWVTPPWLKPPKFRARRVITIEPGMAFGTGTHATTRGCMEFIEVVAGRFAGKNYSALDVGTGSGILSIALALSGAKEIRAIDNDPLAIQVARQNLLANGIAQRIRLSGAKMRGIKRKFDVVVANLTAETILQLSSDLENKVAAKGFLILSGILHQKAASVTQRLARRFRVLKRKHSREWMTLLLQRK
ncbi:MAG TPA: 50S ribosomal protein L11 methyltransferase [Candidatus Binatia bacterium]|nr:50S ribosomal protein L11 methyltransferase [Candidatus Binatia bacterium]